MTEQVQNFPQDNNKCKIFPRRPWLQVRISAGWALKERQCTLEGQARYVNVQGSVHWKGVYRVGDRDLGVQYKPAGMGKFPHMGKFLHLILIDNPVKSYTICRDN